MQHQITWIFLGLLSATLFVWYTRRKNALSLNGALAAAFIGLWVLWHVGLLWLLPLFFFFISSTLFGKFNKRRVEAADAKQGKARDYRQVLCNGGIYAALATWAEGPQREPVLLLMALSISVSTADTWSSELGQYFRQKTWDILRWKPVPVGLSGGVTWAGTLAGLAGAGAMALLCNFLAFRQIQLDFVSIVALGGFAGMLLDSVLGAGLQARYLDTGSGMLSDQATEQRRLISGLPWMSNDGVNWWSNFLVTSAGCLLLGFL